MKMLDAFVDISDRCSIARHRADRLITMPPMVCLKLIPSGAVGIGSA